MKFDELRLTSGHSFQVGRVESETDRMQAKYVGSVPGQAVLITMPKSVDIKIPSSRLQAGDKLKIGLLGANGPANFTTQVISVSGMPFPLVYLSYPSRVNYVQSRKHDRVHIALPIEVRDQSNKVGDAELTDLSLSGGRILSPGSLGEVGDQLTCSMKLEIDDLCKEVTVTGTIRAHHQEAGEASANVFGVEFDRLAETDRLILRSFIHVSLEQSSL